MPDQLMNAQLPCSITFVLPPIEDLNDRRNRLSKATVLKREQFEMLAEVLLDPAEPGQRRPRSTVKSNLWRINSMPKFSSFIVIGCIIGGLVGWHFAHIRYTRLQRERADSTVSEPATPFSPCSDAEPCTPVETDPNPIDETVSWQQTSLTDESLHSPEQSEAHCTSVWRMRTPR